MIEMRDAMRAVKSEDPEAIVLLAETSIMAFADVSEPDDLYLPVGSMSKASSVGLGVALAQPEKNVVIFDGDGSLLMNLGSLAHHLPMHLAVGRNIDDHVSQNPTRTPKAPVVSQRLLSRVIGLDA